VSGWGALLDAMRRTWVPRVRWIGRREADRLLAGGSVHADRRGLADLLAALAAPASPGELRGKDAAVAAFVQAGGRRTAGGAVASTLRRALAAVAVSAAAVLLGAGAWAAEIGALPRPVQQVAHDLFSGAGVPPPRPPQSDPTSGRGEPAESGAARTGDGPAGTSPPGGPSGPSATPGRGEADRDEPPLVQLCRIYQAHQLHPDDVPMGPQSLRRLAAAADGAANIDRFCVALLAEAERDRDTPGPTGTDSEPSPSAAGYASDRDDGPRDQSGAETHPER